MLYLCVVSYEFPVLRLAGSERSHFCCRKKITNYSRWAELIWMKSDLFLCKTWKTFCSHKERTAAAAACESNDLPISTNDLCRFATATTTAKKNTNKTVHTWMPTTFWVFNFSQVACICHSPNILIIDSFEALVVVVLIPEWHCCWMNNWLIECASEFSWTLIRLNVERMVCAGSLSLI